VNEGLRTACDRLRTAPFELVGRFADASNATLLVRLTDRDPRTLAQLADELGHEPDLDDLDPRDLAVHKPERGEAPLWDFPPGTLHRREVAAYEIACALGWDLVPETVLRADGPFGPGSLQRFVPHDPQVHYFALLEAGDAEVVAQLRAMVVFDVVIDNADRKGGHVLLEIDADRPGRVRLVDHGVSLNVEPKLRTVAWEFAGEPVPHELCQDVARLPEAVDGELGQRLAPLLDPEEIDALVTRARALVERPVLPAPSGRHPYPWPLL
jgi:uncharacterized repeat protein (TIGR03843 family)